MDLSSISTSAAAKASSQASAEQERVYRIRSYAGVSSETSRNERGTPAKIELVSTDPEASALRIGSSASGQVNYLRGAKKQMLAGLFADFLVTDIQFSLQEKMQVTPVFGDSEVVYTFGRHPMQVNVSGILFDSPDCNWFVQFVQAYTEVFRATKLAINYELIKITLPNMILVGSFTGMNYSQNASRDTDIPFSFSFLVKNFIPVSLTVPTLLPDQNLPSVFTSGVARTVQTAAKINQLKSSVNKAVNSQSGFHNPLADVLNKVQGSVISPIYGVLSSILKVVKTTGGSIESVVSSFTTPVNSVLKGIQSISSEAAAIVHAVESSVSNVVVDVNSVQGNLANTLQSLKNTRGVIARAPKTVAQEFSEIFQGGLLKSNAAIMHSGHRSAALRATLSSGKKYTSTSGAKL